MFLKSLNAKINNLQLYKNIQLKIKREILPKSRLWRRRPKNVTWQQKKLTNMTSSSVTKVNINSDKSYRQYAPLIWHDKNATLVLWIPSPKHITLIWSWEKHQINTNWRTFYKIPDQYPQNYQGHQTQGKFEKPSQSRRAEGDIADDNEVSWNRKKTLGKSKGNLNKTWALINDNMPVSIH